MKRRYFMKKSVAAAIVAATPLALTGLVNAAGGGGGTNTETGTGTEPDTTGWFDTTIQDTATSTDLIGNCSLTGVHKSECCKIKVGNTETPVYTCSKSGYTFPNKCDNNFVESPTATAHCP